MSAFNPETHIHCGKCKQENKVNSLTCKKCGDSFFTNVNLANIPSETVALEGRYNKAKSSSSAKAKLNKFESLIQNNSHAVINLHFKHLKVIVLDDDSYKNYHILVEENKREIADLIDDLNRSKVESFLFGNILARKIVYAALSIDETGLKSYGDIEAIIDNEAIESRASLLEENSFTFVITDNRKITDVLPKGFKSNWTERHKLAVAKHYEDIKNDTDENQFSEILLNSNGIRESEKFIEIHIFGDITLDAFKKIKVPKSSLKSKSSKPPRRIAYNSSKFNLLKRKLGTKLEFYE